MTFKNEFIQYYKENLKLSESEFDKFLKTLDTPLPLTLRLLDDSLYDLLKSDSLFTENFFLNKVFQCNKDEYKKSEIRKVIIPFTNIGKIYRQEIASMLPVHFLKVEPHHYVLDMCAAPGSKSTQILDILKDGLLVSNDCNRKRVDILKTHINNFNNPGVIITNHDSKIFPNLKVNKDEFLKYDRILCDVPCSGDGTIRKNPEIKKRWNINDAIGLMKTSF